MTVMMKPMKLHKRWELPSSNDHVLRMVGGATIFWGRNDTSMWQHLKSNLERLFQYHTVIYSAYLMNV